MSHALRLCEHFHARASKQACATERMNYIQARAPCPLQIFQPLWNCLRWGGVPLKEVPKEALFEIVSKFFEIQTCHSPSEIFDCFPH